MMIREPRQRYTDEEIAEDHRNTRIFIRWFVGAHVVFYVGLYTAAIIGVVMK